MNVFVWVRAKAWEGSRFALIKVGKNSVLSPLRLAFLRLAWGFAEVDILEREVALRGTQVHLDLLDVDGGVELLPLFYGAALEGGHEVSQATIVDDGALRDEVARGVCSEVEDALHLHVVEGSIAGDERAEALEVHLVSARESCDLHAFTTVLAEGDFPLVEDVLKGFACHSTLCSWAKELKCLR